MDNGPRSMGISNGTFKKPGKKPAPRKYNHTQNGPTLRSLTLQKFSEIYRKHFNAPYIPTEEDSKLLHYNLISLITNPDTFLDEWEKVVDIALSNSSLWDDDEKDALGRPTIVQVINRYNELRLLISQNPGNQALYEAMIYFRDVWGGDAEARLVAAIKQIHSQGYRIAEIDEDMLAKLKKKYSNADLGLHRCPSEDRVRETDEEIEAELAGNYELREELYDEALGEDEDIPLRRRVIELYKLRQIKEETDLDAAYR